MQFSSVLITRLQLTIVLSLFFFFFWRMSHTATNPDLSRGVPTFMSEHENINIFNPGFTFRVVFSMEVGLLVCCFSHLQCC